MPDRRNGPGDERYPSSSRYARPPDAEWTPETEQREEHGTEGLRPGTEGMGATGRDPGTLGREPGMAGPGREPGAAGRDPGSSGRDPASTGRAPGMAGAGREPGMAGRDPETGRREPGMAGPGRDPDAAGRDRSMTARGESGLGTSAPAPDMARMPDDGLGAPSPGDLSGREARTTEGTASDAWPATTGDGAAGASSSSAATAPLLPHEEAERWEERMRQVAAGFVDRPRAAVEEADRALEEIAARFGDAVTRRRRSLRMSWEDGEERSPANETDTEQLRLAMRDYRDLAERLLHS
ncbi:hypothetical protein [Streptomyces sp. WP-1]|nr:hypothetical protein [Streptomyces sp. WP-1]WKE71919.1 hypothetical protein QHG49_24365 [Streptomyces sp. WP-1]